MRSGHRRSEPRPGSRKNRLKPARNDDPDPTITTFLPPSSRLIDASRCRMSPRSETSPGGNPTTSTTTGRGGRICGKPRTREDPPAPFTLPALAESVARAKRVVTAIHWQSTAACFVVVQGEGAGGQRTLAVYSPLS